MATEILVNDGGAPARILPFTAGATISGGHIVAMESDGEVDPATGTAALNTLGFALTNVDSGSIASVVTGKGVIVNALVSGTAALGASLEVAAGDGTLVAGSTAGEVVAVALEAHSGAVTYIKVLTK